MAKNDFFETFVKNHSGFVESNVQAAIAWFCLVFRAFSQINSSTSWPTVGGGAQPYSIAFGGVFTNFTEAIFG